MTIEERFWRFVKVGGPDECWDWEGSVNGGRQQQQYGRLKIGGRAGRHVLAHRLAFEFRHGRAPDPKLKVLHSCNNQRCCNPKHLREGTQLENMQDRLDSGNYEGNGGYRRGIRGSRGALLDPIQRQNIIATYDLRLDTQTGLGKLYNIQQWAISQIAHRELDP